MKRFVKWVMVAAWRRTGVVRRPLIAQLNESIETVVARVVARDTPVAVSEVLDRAIQNQLTPGLARLEAAIRCAEDATHRGNRLVHEVRQDIDLVLDSLVREVVRLQMQVEVLQQAARDTVGAGGDPL